MIVVPNIINIHMHYIISLIHHIYIYTYFTFTYASLDNAIYTVTTFKYVEGGPDREAPEVVWNTSSYI